MRETYRLRVFLAEKQPDVVWRCVEAIATIHCAARVTVLHTRCMAIVHSYWRDWACVFPQHGLGRKHSRPIVLEEQQRAVVDAHPDWFLRGLIESDGCRHRRIVRGKNYPAYSFKNHSEDILRLFVDTCAKLGLRCRRSNRVTLSVARRVDVAWLDQMIEAANVELSSSS